jgi:hypothetical protein
MTDALVSYRSFDDSVLAQFPTFKNVEDFVQDRMNFVHTNFEIIFEFYAIVKNHHAQNFGDQCQ